MGVSGVNHIASPPGRRESISRPTSFSSVGEIQETPPTNCGAALLAENMGRRARECLPPPAYIGLTLACCTLRPLRSVQFTGRLVYPWRPPSRRGARELMTKLHLLRSVQFSSVIHWQATKRFWFVCVHKHKIGGVGGLVFIIIIKPPCLAVAWQKGHGNQWRTIKHNLKTFVSGNAAQHHHGMGHHGVVTGEHECMCPGLRAHLRPNQPLFLFLIIL